MTEPLAKAKKEQREMNAAGLKTGFADLDDLLGGLQNGKLYVLGGRPGMGKTVFAINIARNLAIKNEKNVLYVSMELDERQLVSKFLLLGSCMPEGIMVEDSLGVVSARVLREKLTNKPKAERPDVIIIDYLHLKYIENKSMFRYSEYELEYRRLKKVAKKLNIPIFILSQIGRDIDCRQDKRPLLTDIQGFDIIGEDGDVAMFLYRDDYYYSETDKQGIAELIIRKNNMGDTGTVYLEFIPERILFRECEIAHDN